MKPEGIDQSAWDATADAVGADNVFVSKGVADVVQYRFARAIMAATLAERKAIIQICEDEKKAFLSREYAAKQPLGSLLARFAISECIAAIRKRGEA